MKYRTCSDEADPWDDLRGDPRAVRFDSGELARQNRKHGRAKTDEHIGAQTCGLVTELPFQTNHSTENRSQQQTHHCRSEACAKFMVNLVDDLMDRIHSCSRLGADSITGIRCFCDA